MWGEEKARATNSISSFEMRARIFQGELIKRGKRQPLARIFHFKRAVQGVFPPWRDLALGHRFPEDNSPAVCLFEDLRERQGGLLSRTQFRRSRSLNHRGMRTSSPPSFPVAVTLEASNEARRFFHALTDSAAASVADAAVSICLLRHPPDDEEKWGDP